MVRLFNVYYPVRTLVLLLGEALIFTASFLLAAVIRYGPDAYLVLNYENGLYKILGITLFALLCSYYCDLYAPQRLTSSGETYFRLLVVLGLLSFVLAGLGFLFPHFMLGQNVFLLGVVILTLMLLSWRATYAWMVRQPFLRERVYILGAGDRAQRIVEALRSRSDLGMDVVGWAGATGGEPISRESLGNSVRMLCKKRSADRVIVAITDRRGTMPVRELLDLRLSGIKIEDANSVLEKISGKIEVDALHPSAMIFADGFRLNNALLVGRRAISILASLTILLCCAPLIPFIVLAIKLSSPGPVLFRQERVGRNGDVFELMKFRTMREDAEQETGPTWAADNDPRVTTVGRILRITRLDEIPQLWNVLRGDMGFVGPRPERPEFVQWLSEAIPYYHLRHIIRPGITGWAQVRYQYGASLEQTKQKLQYDLYYIKHMSVMLDLLIVFETIKTVIQAKGK